MTRARRGFVVLVLAGLGSCAAPERPPEFAPEPDSVRVSLVHFAGTPLGGPGAASNPAAIEAISRDPARAFPIRARILLARGDLPPAFVPVGTRSVLAAATTGDRPFLSAPWLSREVRVSPLEDLDLSVWDSPAPSSGAQAWVEIGNLRAALPRGVTVGVAVEATEPAWNSVEPGILAARVEVHEVPAEAASAGTNAGTSPRLHAALVIEGRSSAPPSEAPLGGEGPPDAAVPEPPAPPPSAPPLEFEREVFLLGEFEPAPGRGWAIALPKPGNARDEDTRALVLIEGSGPPAETDATWLLHADALERCRREVEARARTAAAPTPETGAAGIESSMEGLLSTARRRRALAYLASKTGARLAEELCVSGSDEAVGQVAEAILVAAKTSTARDEPSMGWLIEKTTLATLAGLLSEKSLPLEVEALLIRRAGEAGRQPGTLAEVLRDTAGLADFEARLLEENQIALEDASPGARVRAFDWLSSRRRAPPGYDPLAPSKERRAALEKALEKALETQDRVSQEK